MKKPELVIFDMDGLLIDTEAIFKKAWISVGNKYDYKYGEELFLKVVGLTGNDVEEIVKKTFNDVEFSKNYINEASQLANNIMLEEGIKLKEGALELLNYLEEKQILLAIATTTKKQKALKNLEEVNIINKFQYILCGDQVKKRKPDPEIYLTVINKFNVSSENAIVLEDSKYGVQSAYSAGIKCIMVPDLIVPTKNEIEKSFCITNNLRNVIKILENN